MDIKVCQVCVRLSRFESLEKESAKEGQQSLSKELTGICQSLGNGAMAIQQSLSKELLGLCQSLSKELAKEEISGEGD